MWCCVPRKSSLSEPLMYPSDVLKLADNIFASVSPDEFDVYLLLRTFGINQFVSIEPIEKRYHIHTTIYKESDFEAALLTVLSLAIGNKTVLVCSDDMSNALKVSLVASALITGDTVKSIARSINVDMEPHVIIEAIQFMETREYCYSTHTIKQRM